MTRFRHFWEGSLLRLTIAFGAMVAGTIVAGAQANFDTPDTVDGPTGTDNPPADLPFKDLRLEQEPGWAGGLLDLSDHPNANSNSEDSRPQEENGGIRFRVGNVEIRPVIQFSAYYDDNLFLSPKLEVRDFVTSVTPGFVIGMGNYTERKENYLSFAYTPNFIFYQSHPSLDLMNQAAIFTGQGELSRLSFGGTIQWESLETADRDAGGRILQDNLTAEIRGKYVLSESINLEMKNAVLKRDTKSQLQSTEFNNRNWFVYNLTSKLDLSGGVTFGTIEPSRGSKINYQQLLLRTRLESSEKLSFDSSFGTEHRQFSGSAKPLTTPVFDLGGKWTPLNKTEISLTLYRRLVSSNATQSHNYITTGFSSGVRQRFYRDLILELTGGLERSQYFTTDLKAPKSPLDRRSDEYVFARSSLALPINTRTSLSLYYFARNNTSNTSQYSFDNNQVGLEWKTNF